MKIEIEIDEEFVRENILKHTSIGDVPNQVAWAVVEKAKERMANDLLRDIAPTYAKDKLADDIHKSVMALLEPAIKQLAEDQMRKVWSETKLEQTVKRVVDSRVQQIIEDKAQDVVGKLLVVAPETFEENLDAE